MIIATWNVNSIRVRLGQIKEWLKEINPDLLCLQETKVEDALFPLKDFEEIGYKSYFHGQKSYNGVALLSRDTIEDIRYGFSGEIETNKIQEKFQSQKRIISCLIKGVRVVNIYVPNGSEIDSDKYFYKVEWLNLLNEYLINQSKREEPLVLLGDFNIALEDRDIHSPEKLSGGIMASSLERELLTKILEPRLLDSFRIFEQDTNYWSWWNYRTRSWERDKGWRIDHIYLSQDLIPSLKSSRIHKEVRGNEQPSDHAPVLTELQWPLEAIEVEEEEFFFS